MNWTNVTPKTPGFYWVMNEAKYVWVAFIENECIFDHMMMGKVGEHFMFAGPLEVPTTDVDYKIVDHNIY